MDTKTIASYKNSGLEHKLKHVIVEFCDDTTIHGYKNIGKESNHIILRIFWTCCLVACSTYCFYSCAQVFRDFYSYSSYTKISVVKEVPTAFPAFSFCSAKSLNMSNILTVKYINNTSSSFENEQTARMIIGNDKNLSDAIRKDMGFKIEDMLYFCYFNLRFCTASDFKYFYNSLYGNCYTFNSGFFDNGTQRDIETVGSNSLAYGLDLILYLGDPSADLFETSYSGIFVSIHNQSYAPFSIGGFIKVGSRTSTDLIVNRNFLRKLPAPYGNCLEDTSSSSAFHSEYFDYIVRNLGYNYTQEYCNSICLQDQTIKVCGCANIWIPNHGNSSTLFCVSANDRNCMLTKIQNKIDNFTAICSEYCPNECYSIDYNVVSHHLVYPNYFDSLLLHNWSQKVGQSVSLSEIPDVFLEVSVNYHSMQYTVTEEVIKMMQSDLLANFGGLLGLFLGMSFLSFVEIIDLIWKAFQGIITVFVTKRQENKLSSSVKPTSLSEEKILGDAKLDYKLWGLQIND